MNNITQEENENIQKIKQFKQIQANNQQQVDNNIQQFDYSILPQKNQQELQQIDKQIQQLQQQFINKTQNIDGINENQQEIQKLQESKKNVILKIIQNHQELKIQDIYDPFQHLPQQFQKQYEQYIINLNKTNNNQHNDKEKNNFLQQKKWLLDSPKQFNKNTQLKFYQQEALTWMSIREGQELSSDLGQFFLDQNKQMHPLWQEYETQNNDNIKFKKLYFNYSNGQISFQFPEAFQTGKGGILADEMGLGKTVMMLALILTNPRPDQIQAKNRLEKQNKIKNNFENNDEKKIEQNINNNEKLQQKNNGSHLLKFTLINNNGTVQIQKLQQKIKEQKQIQLKNNLKEIQNSQKQGGTLIIVPPTLIGQWQREIQKHIEKGQVTYIQFFGDKEQRYFIDNLQNYDIVLTTYQMVRADYDEKIQKNKKQNNNINLLDSDEEFQSTNNLYRKKLFKINWHRIILDEAHLISNIKAMRTEAILNLKGAIKWCLTGTPIQNKLSSLYPPISFIEHFPWNQKKEFYEAVVKPQKNNNQQVFKLVQGILRPVMLRRTKQSKNQIGANIIELPPKVYETIMVQMGQQEQIFYNSVFKETKKELINQISRRGRINMTCVLALLTKMRQCCDHKALITKQFNPFKQWQEIKNKITQFINNAKNTEEIFNFDLQMVPIIYNQEGLEINTQKVYDLYQLKSDDTQDKNNVIEEENQIQQNVDTTQIQLENQVNITYQQNQQNNGNTIQNNCETTQETKEEKLKKSLEQLELNEYIFCDVCDQELEQIIFTKCQHVMCDQCWTSLFDQIDEKDDYTVCPFCRLKLKSKTKDMICITKDQQFQIDDMILNQGQSSKLNQVVLKIQEILQNNSQDKIVVFTYFRGSQQILKNILEKQKIQICVLNGGQTQREKDNQIQNFDDPNYKVFLSTLTSGNVGLNLVQANHCMLISPWWNPVVELQAEERIYRLGQEKQVYIYKFYVEKSVEIRIKELQEKKQQMIDYTLKLQIQEQQQKQKMQDFMKLFQGFEEQ